MKIRTDKKFIKDLKKRKKNRELLKLVNAKVAAIGALIADTETVDEVVKLVPNILKMKGYDYHYLIRLGDFRLGVFFEVDFDETEGVLIFQCCVHRKDIYREFPDE
jgi:mRNA-degrading endonuclease RelE of RelBE toxin-antitoxin system